MQKTKTVLDVIRSVVNVTAFLRTITGELGAGKLARPAREEADGKGPSLSTSPAAYFTLRGGGGGNTVSLPVSRSAAGAFTWLAVPATRPAPGWPNRHGTWPGSCRMGD
jgi:hypothetical protein